MTSAKDFTLCGFSATIDLWPMVDVARAYAKDVPYHIRHPKDFTEVLTRIENQIARLRWCEETCFTHQAWARFDFDTTDPVVLMRRVAQTQAKLARIAARYPARKEN